jgi:hypothetical protein
MQEQHGCHKCVTMCDRCPSTSWVTSVAPVAPTTQDARSVWTGVPGTVAPTTQDARRAWTGGSWELLSDLQLDLQSDLRLDLQLDLPLQTLQDAGRQEAASLQPCLAPGREPFARNMMKDAGVWEAVSWTVPSSFLAAMTVGCPSS